MTGGEQGDMKIKCNVRSWIRSWNRMKCEKKVYGLVNNDIATMITS